MLHVTGTKYIQPWLPFLKVVHEFWHLERPRGLDTAYLYKPYQLYLEQRYNANRFVFALKECRFLRYERILVRGHILDQSEIWVHIASIPIIEQLYTYMACRIKQRHDDKVAAIDREEALNEMIQPTFISLEG
jgi:hypothetical protein